MSCFMPFTGSIIFPWNVLQKEVVLASQRDSRCESQTHKFMNIAFIARPNRYGNKTILCVRGDQENAAGESLVKRLVPNAPNNS